jgi:hypothetical protein
MFSLVGRNAVLIELVTSQFEWGPSSHSRGSSVGQLVTDSKLLTMIRIVIRSIRLVPTVGVFTVGLPRDTLR